MKKIAITGGIASGKSAVCKIIEDLGGYVIYTDKINSALLEDKDYIQKLAKIFPKAVTQGKVDRAMIRNEILLNEAKRRALNSIAHKEIALKMEKLVEKFNGEEIFIEIPLIVESGMAQYFDEIWCVVADLNTKIKRIMSRDNASKQDAEKIIACQKKDEELEAISTVVIENNGDKIELEQKINSLVRGL